MRHCSQTGASAARLNDGDQALSDAVACVMLKPNWFKAHYRGGAALKILKNYPSAADAFGKAMYLDPDNKEIEKEFREVELTVKSVERNVEKVLQM